MTAAIHILRRLTRFANDERASITVEAVMILPIMLWGYFGMFILFEGYRALGANIRVGYTISDMISRETNAINAAYLEGLNNMQDVLTQSQHRTVLRVTVVTYDDDDNEYTLEWSYSTAGQQAIEDVDLDTAIMPYLPPMQDGGTQIIVETWMAFEPPLSVTLDGLYTAPDGTDRVGFGPFYFESLVVTRPRFAGQLIWES